MNISPKLDFTRFESAFSAIDTHTAGECTRIVYDGVAPLQGATMMEKKEYMEKHVDHIRTALMLEPRGHHDMLGAVLCEPVHPQCAYGVIFIDTGGFLNMCGHGTIGVATMLVETGLVEVKEPYTHIDLDMPAGIISTKVTVKDKKVLEVSLVNVPSFVYKEDVEVQVDGKTISLNIVFGGSFFALVDTQKTLDMTYITAQDVPKLMRLGEKIRAAVNASIAVQHPTLPISTVDLVEFYGPSPNPEKAHMRNVVIFGEGQADRSPCGTGTSAKLAHLHAKNAIQVGEDFLYESFLGTVFRGRILETCSVGPYAAVVPQITGSAFITGQATYLVDAADPVKYGFHVG